MGSRPPRPFRTVVQCRQRKTRDLLCFDRRVVDGGGSISVYTCAPIQAPVAPPRPPPPPAGTEWPCISGWEASGIPKDNSTWCTRYFDGSPESLSGHRNNWFIYVALDPADLFFDPANPVIRFHTVLATAERTERLWSRWSIGISSPTASTGCG